MHAGLEVQLSTFGDINSGDYIIILHTTPPTAPLLPPLLCHHTHTHPCPQAIQLDDGCGGYRGHGADPLEAQFSELGNRNDASAKCS